MKKKFKIVNRGRFVSFLLVVASIIMLVVSLQLKTKKAYGTQYDGDCIEVKVAQGDTVWDIAIRTMPDKYDVRKMVYEIIELNHMEDVEIHPGNLIKIPSN